ncbi:MAG: hypothetical protein AMXMBFR16_02640 [Candidatus Uhrbacteria bacterium]
MTNASVLYIANARMPTEKAHGLQIANMCRALAEHGMDVTLVVPKRKNPIQEDAFRYYGIEPSFQIRYIWSWDLIGSLGVIGFWIQQITFSFSAWRACRNFSAQDSVFSRDIFAAWLLSFGKRKVIFEMHRYPERFVGMWKRLLRRMNGIVSTNQWKAEKIERVMGYPKERIRVLPNGFDSSMFSAHQSQTKLREVLQLPPNQTIVLYTGHLYDWKGAHVLADAARFATNILFVFVGGTPQDIERFKKEYRHTPNIFLVGHRPHREIPKYLHSADILVLPNSAKSHESQFSTSPIKLFEYLAAAKPIVASDLPSIHEILGDTNAVFVEPDNPGELAKGILHLIGQSDLAQRMAQANKVLSASYTWDRRAGAIMEWIQRL